LTSSPNDTTLVDVVLVVAVVVVVVGGAAATLVGGESFCFKNIVSSPVLYDMSSPPLFSTEELLLILRARVRRPGGAFVPSRETGVAAVHVSDI
jgi:hypothetical protein